MLFICDQLRMILDQKPEAPKMKEFLRKIEKLCNSATKLSWTQDHHSLDTGASSTMTRLFPFPFFMLVLKPCIPVRDQGVKKCSCLCMWECLQKDNYHIDFEGQRVCSLHDVPHLLKNTRNNLRDIGYTVDAKTVSCTHKTDFFRRDCTPPQRQAPKLCKKHLNVTEFKKMDERAIICTDLESSVAKGISLMIHLGAQPCR